MIVLIPNVLCLDETMRCASSRFAEAFQESWKRISTDVQTVIRDYFQRCPGKVYMCYRMDAAGGEVEPWGRCTWRETRTTMTFLAPFVERVNPVEGLRSVIVHELAHCYRRGNGTWTASFDEEEREASAIAQNWGFEEPTPSAEGKVAWETEVAMWRKYRLIEFGKFTERWWLDREQSIQPQGTSGALESQTQRVIDPPGTPA
jgi:hypothetical protein